LADIILYLTLALACAGFLGLALAPRDMVKRFKQCEDIYEGLDDFALLFRLAEEGSYRRLLKSLRRMVREERNPDRRRVLRGVEEEVLEWLRKQ
jgi:hypothetical protein